MEETFKKATDTFFQELSRAVADHRQARPDFTIRDAQSLLKNMNAVFTTRVPSLEDENDTNSHYLVGVSAGDNAPLFIDAGPSSHNAGRLARRLSGCNARLGILNDRPSLPFIAVDPQRIDRVIARERKLIMTIRDEPVGFSVLYADPHHTEMDAALYEQHIMYARSGHQPLRRPAAADTGRAAILSLKVAVSP